MACQDNQHGNRDLSKVVLIDVQEIAREKKLAELIKNSPKTEKMLKIEVSPNAFIYRPKGTDAEKARQNCHKNYKNSIL